MKKLLFVLVLSILITGLIFAQASSNSGGRVTADPQTPGTAQGNPADALASAAAAISFAAPYSITGGDRLTLIAQRLWGDYRLWPAIWAVNSGSLPDPDLIEPGAALRVPQRLGTGPLTMEEKNLLLGAYVAAYKQYKSFGAARTNNARWVLYEAAMFFDAASAQPYVSQVDPADIAWLQLVLR
ncbi:MAG: hypothetical protein E4H36_11750 [Spirochaetales bacterium]|nr:MAG: hypothetical protein E4H36_11750 [Spirochaetales bacterium]